MQGRHYDPLCWNRDQQQAKQAKPVPLPTQQQQAEPIEPKPLNGWGQNKAKFPIKKRHWWRDSAPRPQIDHSNKTQNPFDEKIAKLDPCIVNEILYMLKVEKKTFAEVSKRTKVLDNICGHIYSKFNNQVDYDE